jgi:two-component system, OmpR family, sensor histidine kinase KdpD
LRAYVVAVAVVLAATLLCVGTSDNVDNSSRVMVYLLGVVFVATRYGRRPSALAAVLGVAMFDFFFVPPHLTFVVSDTQYLVTFAVMLVVSLLISTLAGRVRAQAESSRRREERSQVLYAVSRELATASTVAEVTAATSRHLSAVLRSDVRTFLREELGGDDMSAVELLAARHALQHEEPAGRGTMHVGDAPVLCLPVQGSGRAAGLVAVRPSSALALEPEQLDLADAFARQAGSALERVRLAAEAEHARVTAETERLRNTLLSSVSHDLRTPLAAITGAASSLLQPVELDPATERGLKEAIYTEAERLSRLVSNLLDMTRAESGATSSSREWHVMEELIGGALQRLAAVRNGIFVDVSAPDDLPLVAVDGVLIEQVLVNLLDNAFRHTPPGGGVHVRVQATLDELMVEVADEGPGIRGGSEERVFEKFYREAKHAGGVGLGLAICRAIVAAHGGRIWVVPAVGPGAVFRFALPLGGAAPAVQEEPE